MCGSPREAGGTCRRGAIHELWTRDWYNAGSHRARAVRGVGVALVYLPAYWSELNPVARVFCAVRCCVVGVVYGLLGAQVAAVAGAFSELGLDTGGVGGLAVRLTNFGCAIGISTCVPLSEPTEGVIVNSGGAVGVKHCRDGTARRRLR